MHIFREGNQLTYLFTKYAINCAGTQVQQFNNNQEISQRSNSIIQI